MKFRNCLTAIGLSLCILATGVAQEQQPVEGPATSQEKADAVPGTGIKEKLEGQVRDIGKTLDQSETAQDVSAGILQPIYQAAEWIAFPAFYWVAFAIMTAGLISFAGQLVFAKLFLLLSGRLNLQEIAADLLGLAISAVGLILTTQAATENSGFTRSPAMVLSAAAVGALAGLVFYWWGQRQEFDAARGAKSGQAAAESKRARM
jgi:hypothetical protein